MSKRVRELKKRLKEICALEAHSSTLPEHQIKILRKSAYLAELQSLGEAYEELETQAPVLSLNVDKAEVRVTEETEDDNNGWSQVDKRGRVIRADFSSHVPTYLPRALTATVRMRPDGSCLFQALSYWLRTTPGMMRNRVWKYLSDHASSTQVGGFSLREWIETESRVSIDRYLDKMRLPNTWGGQAEIFAASECFSVTVFVWVPESTSDRYVLMHEFKPSRKSDKTCHLLFNGHQHYDVLTLKDEVATKVQQQLNDKQKRS